MRRSRPLLVVGSQKMLSAVFLGSIFANFLLGVLDLFGVAPDLQTESIRINMSEVQVTLSRSCV